MIISTIVAMLVAVNPAQAEKKDRLQPMNAAFDRGQTDLVKNRIELDGNVVLAQGSLLVRADHADIAQSADGFYQAFATGTATKQVSFRQARDAAGESVEASADRLEYDARADQTHLIGNVSIRQLRGAVVTREFKGSEFKYDQRNELVSTGGTLSKERSKLLLLPPAASEAQPGIQAASDVRLQPTQTPTPASR